MRPGHEELAVPNTIALCGMLGIYDGTFLMEGLFFRMLF